MSSISEEQLGMVRAQIAKIDAGKKGVPTGISIPEGTDPKEWQRTADQLRSFYTNTPDSPAAPAAKAEEALALIRAAELGGEIDSDRIAATVLAAKTDQRLPEEVRFVVASRARELEIKRGPALTLLVRLAAYEASARAMIAEFPAQPAPYQALLGISRDHPDGKAGAAIAEELVNSPGAPETVRIAAATLLRREALVGTRPDLAELIGADEAAKTRDKIVVLYSWRPDVKETGAMRDWFEKQDSPVVVSVGVDLSEQTKARPLELSEPGLIYLIDRKGVLRDVRGASDFARKLAALVKEDAP